jgi:NAD-dependent SIR2 family protein deacetylase
MPWASVSAKRTRTVWGNQPSISTGEIYLAAYDPAVPAADELASLIRERGPAVVLSGAGMSTESGIPDFRSAGGLWEQVDPYEVASIDAFRRDPLRVWRWYGPRVELLWAAQPNEPNEGHLALAELERDGHVTAVATQNIDALHTRAGSADVVELHGSIRRFDCLACGAVETLGNVLAQLEDAAAPICGACGSILKPGVVNVRGAAPGGRDGPGGVALPRDRPPAGSRVVARGLAGRGSPR